MCDVIKMTKPNLYHFSDVIKMREIIGEVGKKNPKKEITLIFLSV